MGCFGMPSDSLLNSKKLNILVTPALTRWMELHNQIEYKDILTSHRGNGAVRIVKIPKIRKEG
nr:MAG TPA: hypothetical protein [Caudoviricetes sp.]